MTPIGPEGPTERRRITVFSKMWTPSSFSVAIRRHPISGSRILCAHLFPVVISEDDGLSTTMSGLDHEEESFSEVAACSPATSLALNSLQSAAFDVELLLTQSLKRSASSSSGFHESEREPTQAKNYSHRLLIQASSQTVLMNINLQFTEMGEATFLVRNWPEFLLGQENILALMNGTSSLTPEIDLEVRKQASMSLFLPYLFL